MSTGDYGTGGGAWVPGTGITGSSELIHVSRCREWNWSPPREHYVLINTEPSLQFTPPFTACKSNYL